MKFIIIAFSALVLLLLACNTTKNKPSNDDETQVEDSEAWLPQLHDIWVLTEMNEKTLDRSGKRPLLELFPGDNRMGGNGGCNNLFGNIKATAQTINFDQIGSTKKYCADEMDMEREFTTSLGRVNRYEIKELKLYLFEGKKMILAFQKVD